MYRAWARLMVFGTFEVSGAGLRRRRRLPAGPRTAVGSRPSTGSSRRSASSAIWWSRPGCPEPGQPAAGSYEGEGYVILRHPDTEAVRQGLTRLVALLRVELVEDGSSP